MNTTVRVSSRAAFGAAIFLSILTPSPAAAQSEAAVEEVTVTASRVQTPAVSAAIPVEVVSSEDLQARQSLYLADVLRGRNSIAVAQSGPVGGLTELRLRGAETNQVQVRMDGIVLNDPAIGSSVNLAHLNLIGVRQLEILRGAQSGVWGSDAVAGVINIDTRPPPDSNLRRISVEGGSDQTYTAALTLQGTGNNAYYALSGDYYDTGGTNAALEGNEDDGYRNATGHLNTGYATERWGVDAVVRYTDARSEFDPTPFPDFVPTDGDYVLDVSQTYAKVGGRFEVSPRWHHRLYYHYLDTENQNVVSGSTSDATYGGRDLFGYQTDLYVGPEHLPQRLTFAYEHSREDYRQRGDASAFGDPNYDANYEVDSLVAEYELTWRRLIAIATARHDDNSDFDADTTFRLAARYGLAERTTVFAGYGTGTKNPTFTELFGFTPDTFIGNPSLRPEDSTSVNVGVEQAIGDYGLVNVNLFRDRLTDEIDGFFFDPALPGFTAANLDGTSRREGVELATRWTLPGRLTLAVDYSYLDATEPENGGSTRELRRPEHTGRAVLSYDRSDRLSGEVGLDYIGDRDDIDFGTFQRVSLDEYVLWYLAARYRMGPRLELRGRIENAFDEDYQDVFGYRSPGRKILVGISADL